MSFDLSKFLTEGLINSVNNGLIPSELATVYAGNYLAKSLITQNQVTQVSDAITAYKAEQVSEAHQSEAPQSEATSDTSASEAISEATVADTPTPADE